MLFYNLIYFWKTFFKEDALLKIEKNFILHQFMIFSLMLPDIHLKVFSKHCNLFEIWLFYQYILGSFLGIPYMHITYMHIVHCSLYTNTF